MNNRVPIDFELPSDPVEAIDNEDKIFMIIWSWGLRCNYDCSYCSPERHNAYSPHTEKENLLKAVDFLKKYKNKISNFIDHKDFHISITGGEPTANPYFVDTVKELKLQVPDFKLDVTTNGAFNNHIRDTICKTFDHITVSYHAEASQTLKNKVLENIRYFHKNGPAIKVNLMMHAYEYWDECVDLANEFKKEGINFVPRIIGESMEKNRFNHQYSSEQQRWMKDFWKVEGNNNIKKEETKIEITESTNVKEVREENKKRKAESASGLGKANIGRYCCGKRDMCSLGADTKTWNTGKIVNHTKFKNWYCLVNFYFLYIDQETDEVYHHQTCKTTWDPKNPFFRDPDPKRKDIRAPIGQISKYENILEEFDNRTKDGYIPMLQCPRDNCGCGVCVPKAKDFEIADILFKKHIKNIKPAWKPSLKHISKGLNK
jgi:MoaA/NifB/PqqE/SkfB family radical SAM enzyme